MLVYIYIHAEETPICLVQTDDFEEQLSSCYF